MAQTVTRMMAYWDRWDSGDSNYHPINVMNTPVGSLYKKQAELAQIGYGAELRPHATIRDFAIISSHYFKSNVTYLVPTRLNILDNYVFNNPGLFKGTTLIILDEILPNVNDQRNIYFSETNYIKITRTASASYQLKVNREIQTFTMTVSVGSYFGIYTLPYYNNFLGGPSGTVPRNEILQILIDSDCLIYRINVFGINITEGDIYTGSTVIPTEIPYENLPQNDPEDSQGNTGQYDITSQPVPLDPLPTLTGLETGFFTIFNPTLTQTQALADYMWNNSNFVDTLHKLFSNPMSCILGFGIVPVKPTTSGLKYVKLGNITATNIAMPVCASRYVEVDCGTLNIKEFIGSFMDYSPYLKLEIYLPYIGCITLNSDDFMKPGETSEISVKYRVDIMTGTAVACVLCNNDVYGFYSGNCMIQLPVTENDFSRIISNGVQLITDAAIINNNFKAYGVALQQGEKQFYHQQMVANFHYPKGNHPINSESFDPKSIQEPYQNTPRALTSIRDSIGLKPNISHGGNLGANNGYVSNKKPYLIFTLPYQDMPNLNNKTLADYVGRPCNKICLLSTLKGYTKVAGIIFENMTCTSYELQEIERLLKEGVVIN